MNSITLSVLVIMAIASINAHPGGAPPETCEDMVPKHGVEPQKSKFPYTVEVSKPTITRGDTIDITISGDKEFKGYLLQVRDNKNKAVGTFIIPDTDQLSKVLTCHGNKNSSATHKNTKAKKNLTLKWKSPQVKGPLTIFATVAENGGVFWAHEPTAEINVV
ncbi:putative defense protein Hdd11 [Agrilus planipennis]|uniref:Defense protein Hdd11 n=1 Tax=Agrilus planipennis TaxID=224129 RepID=A0A7F5RAN1_AGRPL|nr:putative defense protein Hdd11 [Agrilus planipennis]XP_025833025.1 putative defense protein Hdd11 [Agrilus planipennis]